MTASRRGSWRSCRDAKLLRTEFGAGLWAAECVIPCSSAQLVLPSRVLTEDRERKPKPPPRPKGAGGRVETRFHLITRCSSCAAEIQVMDQIQVTDKCKN